MKELCEFRVDEYYAGLLFSPDEGARLGDSVRRVRLSTDDDRFVRVGQLQRELEKKDGKPFFYGWSYERTYTKKELDAAELFHLRVTACFEPAGEECGTVYDESHACKHCGAGRRQTTPLILPIGRIPKKKDIARTIADEVVISDRLATTIRNVALTGVNLAPVQPAGKRKVLNHWYQVTTTSKPLSAVPPTRFGNGPFDDDVQNQYRCPLGHNGGLNTLSEVYVRRNDYDGADLSPTKQLVGWRGGVLVPHPLLIISRRFLEILQDMKIKGYEIEVAYCR